jgi:DNA-binding Xre family transcriptional regulator
MTKLAFILAERGMSQRDLQRQIFSKHGFKLGDDRISKMVNGKQKNYHIQTAKLLAETLEVKIDDIIE